MQLPALVLSEDGWTRVTASPIPTGTVASVLPLLTVDGKVADDLPPLSVGGVLGAPFGAAMPRVALEEVRATVAVSLLSGTPATGVVAGVGPASVTPLVEGSPSTVVAFTRACAAVAGAIPSIARSRSATGEDEPAVWSLPRVLAGRQFSQSKVDAVWVAYGLGQDALLARAERGADGPRFTAAVTLPGLGADAVAGTIAAAILDFLGKQPGVDEVLAADSPLRRHLIGLARVLATHAARGGHGGPVRLERKEALAPEALLTAANAPAPAAEVLRRGIAVSVSTGLQALRARMSNRPSPALLQALGSGAEVILPEALDLVGFQVAATLRACPGCRVVTIAPRDAVKYAGMGRRVQSVMFGKPYFSSLSELSEQSALGGAGVPSDVDRTQGPLCAGTDGTPAPPAHAPLPATVGPSRVVPPPPTPGGGPTTLRPTVPAPPAFPPPVGGAPRAPTALGAPPPPAAGAPPPLPGNPTAPPPLVTPAPVAALPPRVAPPAPVVTPPKPVAPPVVSPPVASPPRVTPPAVQPPEVVAPQPQAEPPTASAPVAVSPAPPPQASSPSSFGSMSPPPPPVVAPVAEAPVTPAPIAPAPVAPASLSEPAAPQGRLVYEQLREFTLRVPVNAEAENWKRVVWVNGVELAANAKEAFLLPARDGKGPRVVLAADMPADGLVCVCYSRGGAV